MKRAKKMCRTCPFREMDDQEKAESAKVPAKGWPCHIEFPYGDGDIQCRGHSEAVRKFGDTKEASRVVA